MPNTKMKDMKFLVTNELVRLRIPRNIEGFVYLRYAILVCEKDISQVKNLTTGLYPAIAIKFNKLPSAIECNIRRAIDYGWKNSEEELLINLFGYSRSSGKKRPSTSHFISAIVDEIKLKNWTIIIVFSKSAINW